MSFSLPPATALTERMTRCWWLVLLTGVAWIAVAAIVFRFDYSSVAAIAWLFGWVAIAVGVSELFVTTMTQGWWKVLTGALGVIFIVVGVVAFFRFWAAGYWDRSATLLVVFVGAMALLRGINEIVLAFRLHEMHSRVVSMS